MPDVTQQTFLGASICSFNANIGWGNQVSTLQISLVEDPANNDIFVAPDMGYPCTFEYDSWRFDGLLNNVEFNSSESGHRTISVTLIDPRQILEGVQVIIDGYSGSINSIYNLYNVYGYLESFGFGNSNVNAAGIPWYTLMNTLYGLINNYPIRHLGVPFFFDFSELPILDQSYRISGNALSLMDIITDLCETASCDFFIQLVGNVIKLRTVSRQYQPLQGRIQDFLDSVGQVHEKRIGYEAEYHPVGKFLVGGQVEQLYYAYNPRQFVADPTEPEEFDDYVNPNNYILPYWGRYDDGSVVLATFENDDIRFNLPASGLDFPGFGFGSYYPSDTGEMSAALAGFENWRRYLCDLDENASSVHFGKATRLQMKSLNRRGLKDWLLTLTIGQIRALKPDAIFDFGINNADTTINEMQQRFFSFISNYAQEYYGRKFLVRLPNVYSKVDSSTGQITTSLEPIDAAYVPENVFANAIGNGLLPVGYHFLLQDNKFQPYVRFDNLSVVDISDLQADDYIVQGSSIFVRCQVEPYLVYLNASASSARAIITLPATIKRANKTNYLGIGFQFLTEALTELGAGDALTADIVDEIRKRVACEILYDETVVYPLFPRFAAIPLRDNTNTYGPWYTYNYLGGAMVFEQNEELVPWNFGSYAAMNTAAQAQITEALYNRNINESGSITVPGAPTINMGTVLISLGPYVTGVSVSVGDSGVTTTYDMNSWSVRPGKMQRYQVEKFKRLYELRKTQIRMVNNLYNKGKKNRFGTLGNRIGKMTGKVQKPKPKQHAPHSSSPIIAGEIVGTGSNTQAVVATSPLYNAGLYVESDTNYTSKGAMSLDGLFRPFTTDTTATNMPHFVEPGEEAASPTVEDLNPLKVGHDIAVVLTGSTRPESLTKEPLQNATEAGGRGIALKGPIVVAGWGYDTSGEIVGTIGDMSTWKCGPIDLRWNNDRGVWSAGESVQVEKATVTGSYIGNDGLADVENVAATINGGADSITIYDTADRNFLLTDENVMVILSGDRWEIMGENGLMRRGTANTTFSGIGTSGPVTCNGHMFNATSDVDGEIEPGDRVLIKYFPEEGIWYIIGADCPD